MTTFEIHQKISTIEIKLPPTQSPINPPRLLIQENLKNVRPLVSTIWIYWSTHIDAFSTILYFTAKASLMKMFTFITFSFVYFRMICLKFSISVSFKMLESGSNLFLLHQLWFDDISTYEQICGYTFSSLCFDWSPQDKWIFLMILQNVSDLEN